MKIYIIYGDSGSVHCNDRSPPLAAFSDKNKAEQACKTFSDRDEWGAHDDFIVVELELDEVKQP